MAPHPLESHPLSEVILSNLPLEQQYYFKSSDIVKEVRAQASI